MNEIIRKIEAEQMKAEIPEFHVGDTVRVSAKVIEGSRERTQVFEGIVLKRQGGSSRETFTVRKNSNGRLCGAAARYIRNKNRRGRIVKSSPCIFNHGLCLLNRLV